MERTPVFKKVADQFWNEIPGLNSLWYRAEADDIIDLRFDLADDTWTARGEVIQKVLEKKRTLHDVFVNFSFVLPDEAYSATHAANSEEHVHAFA